MKRRLLFLITVFAGWLLLFAVQKPVFMLYHRALAEGCTFSDWMLVILNGLKLDASVAGYLTAIPLLLTILSVWLPGKYLYKVLIVYFSVMAVIVSAIFAVDMALYSFWGFRIDATVFFYMQSPGDAMASVPVKLFVQQILVFLFYAFLIFWFFRKLIIPILPDTSVQQRILPTFIFILLGGLMFIPIRGGVTTSTANVGMVYFSNNQFLNHSAINPAFSLLTSLSKQQDFSSQFNFFSESERETLFNSMVTPKTGTDEEVKLLKMDRPNILFILLESFSANVVEVLGDEPDVTPNLNRLSKEGILFSNFYANSFRTDRGLVSILNGYPAQPTTSIMKYPSKSQSLPSISKSLIQEGYVADMLYGGDINFTNMQSYFYSSGYSRIIADRDFPISTRLSKWGANDDVTFDFLYKDLLKRETDSPWFTTFLTLSSHEPFEVPYHRLENPYLNSIAFTDSCIGDFIGKVKQTPIWDNLLIVMVADHGFRYPDTLKEYEPRRYHIPMLWAGGAVKSPAVIDTLACQTDIASTLLNQLNISATDFMFSNDLFDSRYEDFAYYTFHNGFAYIDSTGISIFDNESNKPLLEEPLTGSSVRLDKGKALLQTLYDDMGSR